MSQGQPQQSGQGDLDLETLLALFGIVAAAIAFGVINPSGMAQSGAMWLVDHKVLSGADEALIPLAFGTGLGWRQIGILVCVLVGAIAVMRLRRRRGGDAVPKRKSDRDAKS